MTGGYCGDLLSWVMGRAQEGDAWFTVMGNVNAVAVAVLADTACLVLAEDSPLDDDARQRAAAPGGNRCCAATGQRTVWRRSWTGCWRQKASGNK